MNPQEYVDFIKEHYRKAKKEGLSRFSVEWGKWSTEMNRGLRKKIDTDTDEDQVSRWKYIIIYWTVLSQLLEVYFKSSHVIAKFKAKKVLKEAKKIENIILGIDTPQDMKMGDLTTTLFKGIKNDG